VSFKKKVECGCLLKQKKIPGPFVVVFVLLFRDRKQKRFLSFFLSSFFFYSSVLFWTSLLSSISSPLALFLLSSRFGGGGGGRFCPLRFEPSVVFSSLSSTRRLENEDYI
jgi:hypothetical protein